MEQFEKIREESEAMKLELADAIAAKKSRKSIKRIEKERKKEEAAQKKREKDQAAAKKK